MGVAVAGLLVGIAVLMWAPAPVRPLHHLRPSSGPFPGRRTGVPRRRAPRALLLVPLAPVTVAVVLFAPPSGVLALLAALAALLVLARRSAVTASRTASAVTAAVVDVATALATDLSAGYAPLDSLASLADEARQPPVTPARVVLAQALEGVVGAGRLGGDTAASLRRWSASPGAGGLASVAAAWEVAETTGAGLSPVLDQVAAGLRAQLAADRAVSVALAGARSTARLLAGLPLLGLAMGAGLGASPVGFFLGSLPGRLCLFLGLGLEMVGLAWTDRLAEAALRPERA